MLDLTLGMSFCRVDHIRSENGSRHQTTGKSPDAEG